MSVSRELLFSINPKTYSATVSIRIPKYTLFTVRKTKIV